MSFNFFNYNINLEGTTLESEINKDQDLFLQVMDKIENQIIKQSEFMQFLNQRGYLHVDIKENSIQFTTNPLSYIMASKKFPDEEKRFNIGEK